MSDFSKKTIDVTAEQLEKIAKMNVNALTINNESDDTSLPTSKVVLEAIRGETANLLPLDVQSEWIFDGNSEVEPQFVIDEEVSNSSNNAVSNKSVKKYIDDKTALINKKMSEQKDYTIKIYEEKVAVYKDGVKIGDIVWLCEKTSTGVSKCRGSLEFNVQPQKPWAENSSHFYDGFDAISFPSSFFVDVPVLNFTLEDEFGNFLYTKRTTTITDTGVFYVLSLKQESEPVKTRINLSAFGNWK